MKPKSFEQLADATQKELKGELHSYIPVAETNRCNSERIESTREKLEKLSYQKVLGCNSIIIMYCY